MGWAGPSLRTQEPRRQLCSTAGLPPETQETRQQIYKVRLGEVASRYFPHRTLTLGSEQTLKDLKRSQGQQRGGEERGLANWALRTSPKFTTGVKYQSYQDF